MRADLVSPDRLVLGESPRWDAAAGRLRWVGIEDRAVLWLDPATGKSGRTDLDTMPGTLAPYDGDRVLLATDRGFEVLDTASGRLGPVAAAEADRPDRRMNDGACDPYGRMLAGTTALSGTPEPGPLYRLETGGGAPRAVPVLDGLLVPNGLAWPEPDRLWHIDSPTRRIGLHVYPEHGPVGPLVRSIDTSDLSGDPDGMALDAEGNLWVAFWGGSAVRCLAPDGRVLETVELPVPQVTSVAFGGDALDTLWITTAARGTDPDDPAPHGALFRCDAPVRGLPAVPWAGPSA
ncbi:SMP-30/gluconolactonase/LRE family protein [Streptacidiphilus sp. ASG 303]|uniref:SMP-30/gluconolactonase/LRE family protein n=1 Tax=Streptacidiphilus sp. ASG 303 TaxID=2896847 RepID=UPI001E3E5F98|nr:SMP-30/gluconolactonase/LRE family protein [Streptacidiphilus sp. ASG 303]MCD0483831.1 SMP-30/gluconolactonase/LRE family protein [Streptacidiphilus sp. ASG 303]